MSANIAADRLFRELEADVAARADHLGVDLDQLAATILSFGDPTPLSVVAFDNHERTAECRHSYLIERPCSSEYSSSPLYYFLCNC